MIQTSVLDIFDSPCFWSPFFAWTLAQCTKIVIGYTQTRRIDFGLLVSTGGMPSAHSAFASALMCSVGMTAGFGSPVFMVALAFAMIVMFDASTVRRAAGLQARLLNEIVSELFKEHKFSERKLKELLGHTRLEVFTGMVLGIFMAVFVVSLMSSTR